MPPSKSKSSLGPDVAITKIAQIGDIILHVAPDSIAPVKLLVSSTVLKSISKVFAALLGPQFREGQTPPDVVNPPTIELPEDDSTAITSMCKLLHSKPTPELLGEVNSYQLLRFAVAVDKYQCREVLQLHARAMLLGWLDQNSEDQILSSYSLCNIIAAAFLLDEAVAFSKATSLIIGRLQGRAHRLEFYSSPNGPENYLPARTIDVISRRRSDIRFLIDHYIPDMVFAICREVPCPDCAGFKPAESITELCKLFEVRSWPSSAITAEDAISKLPRLIGSRRHFCDMDGVQERTLDFHEIEVKIQELEELRKGLCLRCIQKDEPVYGDEPCGHSAR